MINTQSRRGVLSILGLASTAVAVPVVAATRPLAGPLTDWAALREKLDAKFDIYRRALDNLQERESALKQRLDQLEFPEKADVEEQRKAEQVYSQQYSSVLSEIKLSRDRKAVDDARRDYEDFCGVIAATEAKTLSDLKEKAEWFWSAPNFPEFAESIVDDLLAIDLTTTV